MLFVIDAQLPPALVGLLEEQGHKASHVRDLNLHAASDAEIWAHALEQDAVILTKDEDFPHRLSQSRQGPRVVWLRIGNTRRQELMDWLAPLLPQIEACFERGDLLVEIR